MRIIVISATSVIAKECVAHWASTGNHEFVFVGRSATRLREVESDFRVRFPNSKFSHVEVDLNSAIEIQEFMSVVAKQPVDIALIAQGSLTDQSKASLDLEHLASEAELNFVSPILFAEGFAALFEKQGFGKLGVIGSVAGDRGRAYNYGYGAAKAGLATYVQGLQQRFASGKVSISIIKPGPTATPMTVTHSKATASPAAVAKTIVAGLNKGQRVIYAPGPWRWIMLVVKSIPFFVFRNLRF